MVAVIQNEQYFDQESTTTGSRNCDTGTGSTQLNHGPSTNNNNDNNNNNSANATTTTATTTLRSIPKSINIGLGNYACESLISAGNNYCSIPYKEVVIVGNGPSGISLSYFLAGNWPYYNGQGESVNDMLHYRLLASAEGGQSLSLVEQDLNFFAQGLEGRSSNPVAILFDELNHPQADLGLELPSLLNWKFNPENKIDHVVIGRGQPGGAWQSMDGHVLTISLGCWMELPNLNFREWEARQEARYGRESRASVASVAQYYCDYVEMNGLDKYFLCDSVITEVTRVPDKHLPFICDNLVNEVVDQAAEPTEATEERTFRRHTISGIPFNSTNSNITSSPPPPPPSSLPSRNGRKRSKQLWKVKGYTQLKGSGILRPFSYITPNLVLACGADKPNVLNVPGENLPFVLHSLNDLEHLIASGHLNRDSDPVMVVGAGLSAADAIIAARFHSISVTHVFRRSVNDSNLIFLNLPLNMYPEYHKVYQMMRDPIGYDNYKAREAHVVTEIRPDHTVLLTGPQSCEIVKVSYICICIGSKPFLSFLGETEDKIGIHPGLPIDCQRNPVDINPYSHECVHEPGLYALGPVAGQNFVRFLQGGALAITNHLVRQQRQAE